MVNRALGLALLAGAALLIPSQAEAQCTGQPGQSQVCAGPTSGSGLPKFRLLVPGDLPGGGTTVPGLPSLSYQWNNAGVMTGSPTLAHTAAGVDTLTGILNVIGTYQQNGVAITFPPSGVILGSTDPQTVTGKTFDTANNTFRVQGILVNNRSGNTGRIPFINNTMVAGNCLTLDANGNIADQGAPCGSGSSGSGTVNNGTQFQAAYYGATGTAVIGNPNFLFGFGSPGNFTVGVSPTVPGSITFANNTTGNIKVQPPPGVALGASVLTWPVRTADIATTLGTTNANNCAKFDAAGNLVDHGGPCSVATAVLTVFGRPGPTISAATNDYNFSQIQGSLALLQMPPIASNNLYGNFGSGAQAIPVGPCASANNALTWAAGSGFGCNTFTPSATPPGGLSGQIEWNSAGAFAGFTMNQDCTLALPSGAITCTKTNNVAFKPVATSALYSDLTGTPVLAPSATTDTTNADNITSGHLNNLRLTAGFIKLGTGLSPAGNVNGGDTINADIASVADFRGGSLNKVLAADKVFTTEVSVAAAATTNLDFNSFINVQVTLGVNITTLTFSNVKAGQAGLIRFTQGSGGQTIPAAINSILKCPGGCNYVLSTTAGASDVIGYSCVLATYCIGGGLLKDVK